MNQEDAYLIRSGESKTALLVHEMKPTSRPYLHSLQLPGSQKYLAENEGLFWAFSNLNGRNYLEEMERDTGKSFQVKF